MYSQKVADEICRRLSEGETLRQICKTDEMPSVATVCNWAIGQAGAPESFSEQYARARALQLEVIADQIVAIADTPQPGIKVKTLPNGKTEVTEGDMIEHRRLQVDSRKWLLSKLRPEKYGDRTQHIGGLGEGDKPLTLTVVHIKDSEE